jgi:hypothetical protein
LTYKLIFMLLCLGGNIINIWKCSFLYQGISMTSLLVLVD